MSLHYSMGVFLRFVNFTNDTKSRKASQIIYEAKTIRLQTPIKYIYCKKLHTNTISRYFQKCYEGLNNF